MRHVRLPLIGRLQISPSNHPSNQATLPPPESSSSESRSLKYIFVFLVATANVGGQWSNNNNNSTAGLGDRRQETGIGIPESQYR